MNRDRSETLIEGYIADHLSDGGKSELANWLNEDASHRAMFRDAIELEHALGSQLKANKALAGEGKLQPDEGADERIVSFPETRRHIKLKMVAAIVVFCAPLTWLVGIIFLGTPTQTLADVTRAMDGYHYVYWKELEINGNVDAFLAQTMDKVEQKKTQYFDLKGRSSRLETHTPVGTFVQIHDHKSGTILLLNPQNNTSTITHSEFGKQHEPMRHPFEQLFKERDAKITKAKLGGVDYGYAELVDRNNKVPGTLGVDYGAAGTLKVWLDLKTLLPVRAEYSLPELKLKYIMTDYMWTNDLKNAEALFSFKAPQWGRSEAGEEANSKAKSKKTKSK